MILGISIDENFVYVSNNHDETIVEIPFAIGRNLVNNNWFIGDEARIENVDNTDIVIDKLYYLLENDGNAKIGDANFDAKALTRIFMNNLFLRYSDIEFVTIVVRNNNIKILSKLLGALRDNFDDPNMYKVTTYSEAFISYIKSKDSSYYDNPIALFDFTEKALTYYELIRYRAEDRTEYWKVNKKEHLSLPLDLLSGETGKKVCDNLLCEFAKECIKEVAYNNIILSGVGFKDASSYREFMTFVCSVTEVDTDINFFAKSATLLSKDILNDNFNTDVVLISDARTEIALRVYARVSPNEEYVELVEPGSEWLNINNYAFNVIADDEKEIKFEYLKVIEGVIKDFTVPIPGSNMLRKDKTNEFEVSLTFTQQNFLQVTITDRGFGEFYEPTFENLPPMEIQL